MLRLQTGSREERFAGEWGCVLSPHT